MGTPKISNQPLSNRKPLNQKLSDPAHPNPAYPKEKRPSQKVSDVPVSALKTHNFKISEVSSGQLNLIAANADRAAHPVPDSAADPRQRGLMVGSLCLLLVALSIVLWHERDFWFPDSPDADAEMDQPVESTPAQTAGSNPTTPIASNAGASNAVSSNAVANGKLRHKSLHAAVKTPSSATAASIPAAQDAAPQTSTPQNSGPVVARTVLPPLQVEVVAGDSHRVVHPGSNSVRVDLQPGAPTQPAPEPGANGGDSATAASVTRNASDRVQMSADTAAVVRSPVRPSYPLLAREMKVQGSVILQALIGRDGVIQNLRLVSGPSILAVAAEDAVRQWRFKPHYEGAEAVETQAKITVNFTISTN